MVNLPFRRKKQSAPLSILDLPFDQYDPETQLPSRTRIGPTEVVPFVSIQDVRDHLTLLGAYNGLYETYDAEEDYARACQDIAVEYRRWAQVILPSSMQEQAKSSVNGDMQLGGSNEMDLPPLGVLMCWHSHMLNPRTFDRECDGAYSALKGIPFPLNQAATAIRCGTMPTELPGSDTPSEPEKWEKTVWDPPDVAAAVIRQRAFIANMGKIGWLKDGFGEYQWRGLVDLQRGIVRYHAWLDLMHTTKAQFFLVPTLDIDLAWHTHQLSGKRYKAEMVKFIGSFIDHDDNAGIPRDDGLQKTSKLWEDRYGWPYLY